jgi:hypothetical protein
VKKSHSENTCHDIIYKIGLVVRGLIDMPDLAHLVLVGYEISRKIQKHFLTKL